MRFRYLEHTSDLLVEACGGSLGEAFENAALAMFEAITDTSLVAKKSSVRVEVEGADKEALLYNWLEALLVKLDAEGMLFSDFKVEEVVEVEGRLRLRAVAWGEAYDAGRHPSKVAVKGVTYHDMEIFERGGRVCVRVLFDI
ncbi:MAG: archease [Candidatus Bathyarchaeia archaeon]